MDAQTGRVRILEFATRGNNKPIRYALSSTDYATLARAVEFEGPPQDGVAWTMIQRFAYLYPKYTRLADLVSAYCQPINPAWFPGGSALTAYVATLRKAGKHDEAAQHLERAKKRPAQAAKPLDQLKPKTIATLEKVLDSGSTSPVPGSVHFRAPTITTTNYAEAVSARDKFATSRKLIANIDYGDPRTNNWFFSEPSSASARVRMVNVAPSHMLVGLALLAAIGLWFFVSRSST